MTAPSSLLDLDDVDALVAADVGGMLRSAALGGAQVRATQAAVDENALERLHDLRPRSIVLVTGDARSSRAAALLVAMLAARIGIPLLNVTGTPPWVGPLDVVVVAGENPGDPRLVESVDGALRRGAEVVVAAPDEGPMQAAGAGRAAMLPPRIPVAGHNGLLRYVAVFLAVLIAVESTRVKTLLPDLGELADAVDGEALRDHPHNEVFHNPAKALASRMQGRRVVLTGDSRATVTLAQHGSEMFLRSGLVTAAAELPDVLVAMSRPATATGDADYDPFFHDEQLDGPAPSTPTRVFVLATESNRVLTEHRVTSIPDVDLILAASEEIVTTPTGTPVSVSPERSEIEQVVVLTGRLEMAAAYLHLIGGH